MWNKIKLFLLSRPLMRFYRVTVYGAISLAITNLIALIPILTMSPEIILIATTVLTAILTAVDKKVRDSNSTPTI